MIDQCPWPVACPFKTASRAAGLAWVVMQWSYHIVLLELYDKITQNPILTLLAFMLVAYSCETFLLWTLNQKR